MLENDMNIHTNMIGASKWEIDTPALLVDLPAMEKNLRQMADFFVGKEAALRPHVKLYNAAPELAHMQLKAGAQGVTCAKLCEAEVLAAAGIKDILIANQIVGPKKLERLVKVAAICDIKVAVDNSGNVSALSQAALENNVSIGVLVEVNIGHNRCGVAPFEAALQLSREVVNSPGLRYMGLMGYDGHCTLKVTDEEREGLALQANRLLAENRRYIEAAGIPVQIVSGSGTFTYRYATQVPGITEVQAGSYLLMDTAFKDHGVREFELTLSVLCTVTSRPTYPSDIDLAVIDIGRKSISAQLGMPEVKYPLEAKVFSLSQEHGRLSLEGDASRLKVSDKVELWVRDSNGTINMFDRIYAIRDGMVEAAWEIPLCGVAT